MGSWVEGGCWLRCTPLGQDCRCGAGVGRVGCAILHPLGCNKWWEGTSSPLLVLAASVRRGLTPVCFQHPLVELCAGGKIAFAVCSVEGRENNEPSQSPEAMFLGESIG